MKLPDIEEIQREMTRHGVKAAELARLSGVEKSVLSKILNGKYDPSYRTMQVLWEKLEAKIKVDTRRVREVMVRPVAVDVNDSIFNVRKLMKDRAFSQVPVIGDERFVGMVTERDLFDRPTGASVAGELNRRLRSNGV